MQQISLFVCGSLSKGMVHFNNISTFVKNVRSANVRGSVYRLEVGYPVFLTQGHSIIEGDVLDLEMSDMLVKILDELHGFSAKNPEKSLFLKTPIQAELGGGESVEVQTYALNPIKLPGNAILIDDGNWKENFAKNPPLTFNLTDKQKTYVRKLGSSSGRDIVPINLDLYRELMNKGLIVDKGRRLALTKLGLEVYRYLEP